MMTHFFTVELRSSKYGYSWLHVEDEGNHSHVFIADEAYPFHSVAGALAHIKMAFKQFNGTDDNFSDSYIYLNENDHSYRIMDGNGNRVQPNPKGHINTCIDCGRREESKSFDDGYVCMKCW